MLLLFFAYCEKIEENSVISIRCTEEAVKNLREACELYIEEVGLPEGISSEHMMITSIEVKPNETSKSLR